MSPLAILAVVAVCSLALLSVVAWYLIQALRQARSTAAALERFLETTRPRLESAADNVNALVGRADRLLASAEKGEGAPGAILSAVRHALSGWASGSQIAGTVSALIAVLVQSWSAISSALSSPPSQGGPSPQGAGHE